MVVFSAFAPVVIPLVEIEIFDFTFVVVSKPTVGFLAVDIYFVNKIWDRVEVCNK